MTPTSIPPKTCNKTARLNIEPIVTFELKDGSKYKLRTLEDLQQHVDPLRELVLVFGYRVFFGFSHGKIDSTGDLLLKLNPGDMLFYGIPAKFFVGWAYRSDKIG